MASLLDVIGAAIVGSLVLLMMFTSLFNMQVINYNTQIQTNLSQMAEDLITGRRVGSTNYLGLETYLSKVGAGVPENTDPDIPISIATSNSFRFLGKVNSTSSISTFHFVQEALTSDGYPLYVYQYDEIGNLILESGPFWLADSLEIIYYDNNNNLVPSPDSNHDSIRSAKISLSFFYNTHQPDIDKRLLRHNIVLWKYFKNLYL